MSSVMSTQQSEVTNALQRSVTYRAEGVTKTFSGSLALDHVSVAFHPGEIHSLVGENGAGKSTLLRILAGIQPPDAGVLRLGEEELVHLTPASAQQRGIYLVPQEPTLMPHLSALENLFVGAIPRGRLPFSVGWKQMRETAGGYFAQVGLTIDPRQKASTLSIAQQQQLECARALVHRCNVIFFDEPTSPLTSHEAEILFDLMRRLRERRFTLGFISHRLDEVLDISDRITVLRDARVVARFEGAAVSRDELISHMVGHEVKLQRRRVASDTLGEVALTVSGLTREGEFSDIRLDVRRGEIVGLAGLVGSGRTELAETVFGLRKAQHGKMTLDGKQQHRLTPRAAIDRGLIYLSEDRGRNGIFSEVQLPENATAAIVPRLPRRRGLLSASEERRLAREAMERTRVRALNPQVLIKALSGGNQQKLMFARWLMAKPTVGIFDEPTRGVDVGAKADIYALIEGMAESGVAVIVISSELEELYWLCDRVIAIYEGRVAGELVGDEISVAALGRLIVGQERA
jgi:ABC-type sugar transport system ATPase subunit